MKKKIYKYISAITSLVLAAGIFAGVSAPTLTAKAAEPTYHWQLTSQYAGVSKGYVNGAWTSDQISGDGSTQLTSGDTSYNGWFETNTYLGKFDGFVRFYEYSGTKADDGIFSSKKYSECSIPPTTIAPDEVVTLTFKGYMTDLTEESLRSGKLSLRAVIDGNTNYFNSADGEHWFESTKDPINVQVSKQMPKSTTEGETSTIWFACNRGDYKWTYTLVKDSAAEPTPEPTTVQAPGKAKISSFKNTGKKKAVVKVKKITKNCAGYEYQISTKKNFKSFTTNISTKNTYTFKKLKKGKTYYVRVRAFNGSGDATKYGKWSATKSVKIKK